MDNAIKRAIVYTRVSTVGQADKGTSLEEQLQAGLAKVDYLHARFVGHEEDAGVSGAYYAARPGIQRAIERIERGEADTLIIANFDRFSRDREHQSAIKKRVENAGGRLVFCDIDFDDTPEGDLQFGIMGSFAEYERKRIRERTVKGRRSRAEQGIQVSRSMRPYGYNLINRNMVLAGEAKAEDLGKYFQHPEEAPWVRFMFESYAAGDSLRQIALKLHSQGVPTARGGREWEPETISGILRNPVHKGTPTFGREKRCIDETRQERGLKSTHFNRPAAPDEVIILSAPAIVFAEVWDAANARLDHNKVVLSGRRDRKWLLTGLFRCPKCGLSMRVQKARPHEPQNHYSCKYYSPAQTARRIVCDPTRYAVPLVEETVMDAIERFADSPESIEAAFDTYIETFTRPDTQSERERIEKQLGELTKRERATVEAQIAGLVAGVDASHYGAVFAEIQAKRAELLKAQEKYAVADGAFQARNVRAEAQALAKMAGVIVNEILHAPELEAAEKHGLLTRIIRRIVPREKDGKQGIDIELHSNDALTVAVMWVSSVTLSGGPAGPSGPNF